MKKLIFLALVNFALISCGDNTGGQPGTTTGDSTTMPDSGATVDSAPTKVIGADTSSPASIGNTTPSGATDGSNNTGAVGGSNSATSGGTTTVDTSHLKVKKKK